MLSDVGKAQALRVRDSIAHLKFDKCFASPISRAKVSWAFEGYLAISASLNKFL